jgi:hypothetical protein
VTAARRNRDRPDERRMKMLNAVGARTNVVKIAPLLREIRRDR